MVVEDKAKKKQFSRKRKKKTLEKEERLEKVIQVSRVTKVVKGGKKLGFRAAIVSGTKEGEVGVGIGKASEVTDAIQKGITKAKKNKISFFIREGTISHKVIGECGASRVLLRPAPPGTGVIAGGAVRTVLEFAGIMDVVAKSLGSANIINVAKATVNALSLLKEESEISKLRDKTLSIKKIKVFESTSDKDEVLEEKSKFQKIEVPIKKRKPKVKDESKNENKNEEKAEKDAVAGETEKVKEEEQKENKTEVDNLKKEEKPSEETTSKESNPEETKDVDKEND